MQCIETANTSCFASIFEKAENQKKRNVEALNSHKKDGWYEQYCKSLISLCDLQFSTRLRGGNEKKQSMINAVLAQ